MSASRLIAYYGDDFTGSTDVMEALAAHGVPTVLFLKTPDAGMLARFADCRAVGIAGTSRSETPAWMETALPPVFDSLKALGADLVHYKVCSTFDSAPAVGSIGRALEIGAGVLGQATVPVLVGVPQLRRYTAFGHLFAGYQTAVHRIDRHPVMSRHPVTPMDEADLTVHLARQTAWPIRLAGLDMLAKADATARVSALAGEPGIVFLDVDSLESQAAAGAALLALAKAGHRFVVGSSGVEYALIAAWRAAGLIGDRPAFAPPGAAERIAVVSGSVSPTTERQIRHATGAGFDGIPVDPLALTGEGSEAAVEAAIADGLARLEAGRSVILHTALGPSADRGAEIDRDPGARHRLGRHLGRILTALVTRAKLTRAVIAGGDTSSHALSELGVEALTTLMPLPDTPGSPLCRAHGNNDATDGLEIALKGGQVGSDAYFSQIRDGRTA